MIAAPAPERGLYPVQKNTLVWMAEINLRSGEPVTLSGDGISAVQRGDETSLYLDQPLGRCLFLKLGTERAEVFVPGGGVIPVYARQMGQGRFVFSNVASRLIKSGETLTLDGFVLCQNLSGIPYPQNNFFKDIDLLEPSALYDLHEGKLQRRKSLLEGGQGYGAGEAIDVILASLDPLFKNGQPVAVLLSGGYDSRLNLALALELAKRHGNAIHTYHEYKDAEENAIAVAVAEAAGVPLTIKTRTDFAPADRPVFLDEAFIDLQSGTYRENLMRWHAYLDWIRKQLPGCLVLGHGAEAHKGKYYKKVRNPRQDAEKTFGTDPVMVRSIALALALRQVTEKSQSDYFHELAGRSEAFGTLDAQTDYLHYHTYVCNGYGKRGHDLLQHFGLAFPFLETDFLRNVFAMKREDKEGFRIVSDGIRRFAPMVMDIPLTSANKISLLPPKLSYKQMMRNLTLGLLGPAYYDFFPVARKGRKNLTTVEKEIAAALNPQSDITHRLMEAVLGHGKTVPFSPNDYLMQTLLYLSQMERQHTVTFKVV